MSGQLTLNDYLQQTQRFIRDQKQELINPEDLIVYINRARRQIALQAQCLRGMPPTAGPITTITVTAGGTGYSASPTITITAPDSPTGQGLYPSGAQATAVATVTAGVITDIQVTWGGDGYFQPQVTIIDSTGTGATATANTISLNVTRANKEVYNFADVDLSALPGIDSILAVTSVSFIYANYRYSACNYSFNVYQARIRQYPRQYLYVPTMYAQLGQGTAGSLFEYPIPSTVYQQEWNCIFLPQDLIDSRSVEALPAPWTDAVPLYAAYMAFLELQNPNYATNYLAMFDNFMHRYGAGARPGVPNNRLGRY